MPNWVDSRLSELSAAMALLLCGVFPGLSRRPRAAEDDTATGPGVPGTGGQSQRAPGTLPACPLLEIFGDPVLLIGADGRIAAANASAEVVYGYRRDDLPGMKMRDLEASPTGREPALEGRFGSLHRRRDGSTFPVEVSSGKLNLYGAEFQLWIVRDVTRGHSAEQEEQRVIRRLRVLGDCNRALARADSEQELLDAFCRILVEKGGYRMACVRYTGDGEERDMRAVAVAGHDDALAAHEIRELVDTAIRTGEPTVSGGRSTLVVPLRSGETTLGGLGVSAAIPSAPRGEEQDLLMELAGNLSFRILSLRRCRDFRTLFDSISDAVFVQDIRGRFLEASEAACRRLGYRREELIGQNVSIIDAFDDPDNVRRRISELLETGETVFESAHVRRDGTKLPVEVSGRLIEWRGERAAVAVVRDLSERKRTEWALLESQMRLREAQRLASLGSWEVLLPSWRANPGEDVYVWSDEVYRIFGVTPESFQPSRATLVAAIHPDDRERFQSISMNALRHGNNFEVEHRIVRPDGTERVVRELAEISRDESGRAVRVVGTIQDITEYRQLEERFRQVQKLESIGRLAGGVAHDFNNLLTVINGYSEMVLARLPSSDALHGALSEILKAGQRAAALTQQLLAFSRRQVMQPKLIDLNEVIGDAGKMLTRLIGEDIEMRTVLDPLLGRVLADPGQIHQVLLNLAVNARDAMPDGGRLTIFTSNVEVTGGLALDNPGLQPGWYVVVRVSDTGAGMSKDVQEHIFEPFFTTKPGGSGTGLGLATVYGIVKQSGGWIWVDSAPGEGAVFSIYLPCAGMAPAEREPEHEHRSSGGSETILVVEDQEEVRQIACLVLRSLGYRVLEAGGGAEAIEVAAREPRPIHLLLTDVVMPSMTGRELAERLSPSRPSMSVLYMSGYTDTLILRQVAASAGFSFLQKPFSPHQLASAVRAAIQSRAAAGILVVDDDSALREVFQGALAGAGYSVRLAGDGREAMAALESADIGLVITDLVMPEQEGLETIRKLRARKPDLKIVAVSGAFDGQYLKAARLMGADGVLQKPVSPAVLVDTVERLLG